MVEKYTYHHASHNASGNALEPHQCVGRLQADSSLMLAPYLMLCQQNYPLGEGRVSEAKRAYGSPSPVPPPPSPSNQRHVPTVTGVAALTFSSGVRMGQSSRSSFG